MEYKLLILTGELPVYNLNLYKEVLGEELRAYSLFPMGFESTIIGINEIYSDPSAEQTFATIRDALEGLGIDEVFFQYGELPYNTESKALYHSNELNIEFTARGYYESDQREVIIYCPEGFKFAEPETGLPTHPIAVMEGVELDITYEQIIALLDVSNATGLQMDIMAHVATGERMAVLPVPDKETLNQIALDPNTTGVTFYQVVKTLAPHEIIAYYESNGVKPKVVTT